MWKKVVYTVSYKFRVTNKNKKFTKGYVGTAKTKYCLAKLEK